MEKELDEMNTEAWFEFDKQKIPKNEANYRYLRQQIDIQRQNIIEKYSRLFEKRKILEQIIKDRNWNTTVKEVAKDAKVIQLIAKSVDDKNDFSMLSDILNGTTTLLEIQSGLDESLQLKALRKAVKEKLNIDLPDHVSAMTPEEEQEMVQFLSSPEADELAEHFEKVFDDKYLRQHGFDPEAMKPQFNFPTEEEMKNGETKKMEEKYPLYNPFAMENFKHLLRKEIENNPDMKEMFEQQFGIKVESLLQDFDKNLQSGALLNSMNPEDMNEYLKEAQRMARLPDKKK